MRPWLTILTDNLVLLINLAALFAVAVGTVGMIFRCVRGVWPPTADAELRDGYLDYARWLIAGLTLQLGADIVQTASAPTWEDIGRLAAIAVVRTFLNYFLERDTMEASRLKLESARPSERSTPRFLVREWVRPATSLMEGLCASGPARRSISGPRSNRDPLDLVKRDLIASPIIEFGRARAFVRRHGLRVLQRADG